MDSDVLRLISESILRRLTREERQQLMRAALEDQDVFDEMCEVEPLRQMLQDPAHQNQLLAVLGSASPALVDEREAPPLDVRGHSAPADEGLGWVPAAAAVVVTLLLLMIWRRR